MNVMLTIIPGRWRDVQPRFGPESAFLQGFERWVTPYTVFAQLSTVPMRNAYGLSRLFSTCFRLHLDFVVNGARFSQWESREAVWGAVNEGPSLRVLSWGPG